jgi:hypothetical protein
MEGEPMTFAGRPEQAQRSSGIRLDLPELRCACSGLQIQFSLKMLK